MRKRDLEQIAAKWRARLRIQNWTLRIARQYVSGWPVIEGDCSLEEYTREAVITIDPRSTQPERILLHELVHMTIAGAVSADCPEEVEEPVVWSLTDALLESERSHR